MPFQVFTAHYQHFVHFFDGSQGGVKNGWAGEEEKTITAQLVYHFIRGLEGEIPSDKQLLHDAVSCLETMVVTLSPDSHVPPFSAAALVSEATQGYEPHTPDLSNVKLFPEIVHVGEEYARYQHDCYVFEKVVEARVNGSHVTCMDHFCPFPLFNLLSI